MFVDFNILNQLGSPSINSNTFANRPAAGQTGRLFVSTDTFEIYRDNGTTWDLIGGPGSSTITGTGTATQVAYFTSSQAIGSSANLFWDNTNTRLGIGTATPGAALDIHSTGIMAHFNTTSATGNSYIAFQRTGTSVWRLGDQYNAGANFFQIHNIALSNNAIEIATATNKSIFTALQTYTTGLARGNYFDYNLSVSAGGSFSSPNAITALGASLDLTLAGNATIPSGARSGLDAYNSIAFTGAGTLTHTQGTQIRAYSNLTAGWAFNGSATGTITHLAGLRALFPDNTGSAINVTNNYALLLNDQTPNTGTVTYTNRWGVYQEGASDLNYMAANLLLGSTVNNGNKLQVTGNADFTGNVSMGTTTSAGGRLDVVSGAGLNTYFNSTGAGIYLQVANNGTNLGYIGDGSTLISGGGSTDFVVRSQAALAFSTNGNTERMRLDASGNLGLGVSPSAWNSGLKVQQIGYSAFVLGSGSEQAIIGSNWYQNTSAANVYLNNGFATFYQQISGTHQWYNAPSGTAGNAITFTQAMTLTASGRLGIGTGTPSNNFVVSNGGAAGFELGVGSGSASGGTLIENYNRSTGLYVQQKTISLDYIFDTNAGTAINIKNNGNTLIGTTTDAGYKLQVAGNSLTRELVIDGANNGNISKFVMTRTDQSWGIFNETNLRVYTSSSNTTSPSTKVFEITTLGNVETTGSIKTAAPTAGTAQPWKFGSRVAAAVALDATQYIELDVNGTLYKLAIVT